MIYVLGLLFDAFFRSCLASSLSSSFLGTAIKALANLWKRSSIGSPFADFNRVSAFMLQPFFFFPRRGGRCAVSVGRFIPPRLFASQFPIGNALASDALRGLDEPIRIIALAVVESKALLVKVAEQMKRFYRNVCTFQGALEQTPKVFDSVGVNLPVNVSLRVIDNVVNKLRLKVLIGDPLVGVKSRAVLNVALDMPLQGFHSHLCNNVRSHFAVTLKQAHHGNLATVAPGADMLSLVFVHVASKTTDEGFVPLQLRPKTS